MPKTDRSVFAVITWGAAASHWLTAALNSHPQIFCSHAINHGWSQISKTRLLDGLEFINAVKSCFDEYPARGDVHGLARHHIPEIRNALGDEFGCAVLVREPIARLQSALAFSMAQLEARLWGDLDYVLGFGSLMPEDSYKNRLILHNMNMLNAIVEERALAPIWRQEDLTTNPEKLLEFVTQLTNGVVEPDLEWGKTAIALPRVGPKSSGSPRQFAEWEISALRKIVETQAWDAYAELGYEAPEFAR